MDELAINRWFSAIRNPLLDFLCFPLSILFSSIASLAIAFLLWWRKRGKEEARFLCAMMCLLLLCFVLKTLWHRERPGEAGLIHGAFSESSFPSGHAAISALFAVFGKKLFKTRLFIFLAILTPISRLYLNVHYLSDVLVGSALGIAIGLLFSKL